MLDRGYNVICLDKLLFGDAGIKQYMGVSGFKLVVDDTRTFNPEVLNAVDAIVDLQPYRNQTP
ncbi:MAG: hypothetical protein QXE75_04870 [Sulfolobales archaeon]